MEFISYEFIVSTITPALGKFHPILESRITENLVVLVIVWLAMRKKITAHFVSIQSSLASIAKGMEDLKTSLTKIEKNHSRRIQTLEQKVDKLQKVK